MALKPASIQALRKRLRENTAQFGARFGRSGRTIEDWEQGRAHPDRLVQRLMQELATGLEKNKKGRR